MICLEAVVQAFDVLTDRSWNRLSVNLVVCTSSERRLGRMICCSRCIPSCPNDVPQRRGRGRDDPHSANSVWVGTTIEWYDFLVYGQMAALVSLNPGGGGNK